MAPARVFAGVFFLVIVIRAMIFASKLFIRIKMKKEKKDSAPASLPENGDGDEELDLIIRRKKIQNKVLKELIDQLKKHPVSRSQEK